MKSAILLILLGMVLADDLLTPERAHELEDVNMTWKVVDVDESPLADMTLEHFKGMLQGDMDAIIAQRPKRNNTLDEEDKVIDDDDDIDLIDRKTRGIEYDSAGLPINFDGRTKWGRCIHSGGDQGNCNGCWAFGIVNHLSDRFCIHGVDVILSVQDLLECTPGNNCCSGGYATKGYEYLMSTGIVSKTCKAYRKKCTECRPSQCTHYKCKQNSIFWANTIREAKTEIYKYGPIEAVFKVYDDFPYYSSGVYKRKSDNLLGIHTVEVLGWGIENGSKYWLCKNSWGDDWGDNGFFKILMGDCNSNSALTTCRPLV